MTSTDDNIDNQLLTSTDTSSVSSPTLPYEILIQIVKLAAVEDGEPMREDWEDLDDYISMWRDSRREFLMELCELSKGWAAVANALLWREVHLTNDASAKLFLASPALRYHTIRSLTIYGPKLGKKSEISGVQANTVLELVTTVRNLDRLALRGFCKKDGLRFSTLTHDNLHTITSLSLNDVYLTIPRQKYGYPRDSPFTLRAPFTLNSLRLHNYRTPMKDPFTFFFSSTLQEFRLVPLERCFKDEDIGNFHQLMEQLHPQLRLLEYHVHQIPELATLLSCFNNLSTLEIDCKYQDLARIFDSLPSKLQTLTYLCVTHLIGLEPEVMIALEKIVDCSSLEKLKVLRFYPSSREDLLKYHPLVARRMLDEWEKRGVVIEYEK